MFGVKDLVVKEALNGSTEAATREIGPNTADPRLKALSTLAFEDDEVGVVETE
jgi:hypothetical protein